MKCDWISGPTNLRIPHSRQITLKGYYDRSSETTRPPQGILWKLQAAAAHREGRWLLIWVDNLLCKLAQGMSSSESNNERLLSHPRSFETNDFN